jgi:uncharacterized protein with PIN domain
MSPDSNTSSGQNLDTESRFIADRMLGTLTRYLRFMGYDTTSANGLAQGNAKEDTYLLKLSLQEHRILLTRDAELSRRGKDLAILVISEDVMEQVQQLIGLGLIKRRVTMSRCSLCNSRVREAFECEIAGADYAPRDWRGLSFHWCEQCRKLYWNGSHGRLLGERIGGEKEG